MKFLVVITSTIFYTEKPLSYSNVRSIFTPNERIQQTLHTIQSVKEKIPNATIVVIETGIESVDVIKNSVDQYIFLGNYTYIRYVCDGPLKGLGEIVGILSCKKYLRQYDYDMCIKISGRYYLDTFFTINQLNRNKFSFVMSSDHKSYSTRCYSFPKKLETYYIWTLYRSIPILLLRKGVEHVFKKIINPQKVSNIDRIGVSGYIAPTGEFIQE